jgi:ribosomal protein S18 acetylase RimI-like enzyme
MSSVESTARPTSALGHSAAVEPIQLRQATSSDAESVGRLHGESWRRHYRGVYADGYLDDDVFEDRIAVWTERLCSPDPDCCTIVAEMEGEIVGFAHTLLDDDPLWGALLDNLHVTYECQHHGVGRTLMAETALVLGERRPASGLYLWVLQQNVAAQGFYRSRGGVCVEETIRGPVPGGGYAASLRYAWQDPSTLLIP